MDPEALDRRVFLHFVDDEIIQRLGNIDSVIPRLHDLIVRWCFFSPEPPVFPVSSIHELETMADAFANLLPLVDAGQLLVMGAGSTPTRYLAKRQRHYQDHRDLSPFLFRPQADDYFLRLATAWWDKGTDTTAEISQRWPQLAHECLRTNILAIPGRGEDAWIELPRTMPGLPLVPQVVLAQARSFGVITKQLDESAVDWLTAKLAQQWARAYASAARAYLVSDLGPALPTPGAFNPPDWPAISSRRLGAIADRLGLTRAIAAAPLGRLASWLNEHKHMYRVALDDWFGILTHRGSIWSPDRFDVLVEFDRLLRKKSFALAWFGRATPYSPIDEIERRTEAYTHAVARLGARRHTHVTMTDRSIRIGGSVGGSVNTGDNVRQVQGGAVDDVLRQVASGDGLSLSNEVIAELSGAEVTEAIVAQAVAAAEEPHAGAARLRELANDLSRRAAGSVLAAGILGGLQGLGL